MSMSISSIITCKLLLKIILKTSRGKVHVMSSIFAFFLICAISIFGGSAYAVETDYDIAILNARVIDPETKLDEAGMNIAVRGSSIVAITHESIRGKIEIDAKGMVASPGFIDVLSYDPNQYGVWYKVADGVTTNLAMHGGAVNPKEWYASFERQKVPVNFGAGFFYNSARLGLEIGPYSGADEKQMAILKKMAEKALENGALGIGMSLEYAPGTTKDEVRRMMEVAKRYNVPVFFHVRYSTMEPPGTNIEALDEVLGLARETGAAIHIDHINSTGGTFSMAVSLEMIRKAADEGVSVTACVYPYDFWATYLNSARFDEGWQKRFRITFNDLQLGGSSERLTVKSFEKYKKLGKLAVAYAIPEDDVIAALRSPYVMIASDGIIEPGNNNHPRSAGAFSRLIAKYVREKKVLTLTEAIGKMTILPAKRLESASPAFKKKGRLQIGADADIVIFDFEKIQDTATVEKPNSFSTGIAYVLVNGKIVKDLNGLRKSARPGTGLRSALK